MKLVLKRTRTDAGGRCGSYVRRLKRTGLFKLTNDLNIAKKFDSVPELLVFVAGHDSSIGSYEIVKIKKFSGWHEVITRRVGE